MHSFDRTDNLALTLQPEPRAQEFHNFSRLLNAHYNYAFTLNDVIFLEVEKKIFEACLYFLWLLPHLRA